MTIEPGAAGRLARRLLVQGAATLGAARVVGRSAWRERRLLILCYHGISLDDEHEWCPMLYMPAAMFRRRMARLRSGRYNPLPLAEAVDRLRAGTLPPRSVAVTFDDGFYDFHAAALPVLREFDVPATNYVPTFYSLFQRPVFDPAAAYLLWKGRAAGRVRVAAFGASSAPLGVATPEERAESHRRLLELGRLERMSAEDKDALLAALAGALGLDHEAFVARRVLQQMGAAELRSLPRDLVDVQLHTHRHRMPGDHGLLLREIAENRQHLAALTADDAPRAHFCYPSGEYDARYLPWLADAGVRSATTTESDIAAPGDHPLALPRYMDAAHRHPAMFDAWLSGLYPAVLRLHERLDRRRAAPAHRPFLRHSAESVEGAVGA